jgi:hypothetical protein
MNQFDWAITQKTVETMEASPKQKILWKDGWPLPLAQVYRWKGEDCGQNIWDSSELILGTHWESDWIPLGTWWEHIGNKGKMKKILCHPHPKLKEKNRATFGACWAFPLAARNFYFQNSSATIFGLGSYLYYKLEVPIIFHLCYSLDEVPTKFHLNCFLQWPNLIGASLKKKMKWWRLPKIEGSKYGVPPPLP